MRILFIGDVVGRPGRKALRVLLPGLKDSYDVDFCIANGENAAGGKGITEKVAEEMFSYGVDVLTSGNHIWDRKEGISYVQSASRLLRPANYPPDVGGIGYGAFPSRSGVLVGVINLQGRTFMPATDCPFRTALRILEEMDLPVKFVDFHAEATSEKVAMGWFLDGKV
ncbi:MAG: metallophosphoesterase, partial [Candidatus Latescibacterota bacterium]